MINDHFPKVPGNFNTSNSEIEYFKTHCGNLSEFKLKKVSEETILKIIKGLKSNAVGVDGISLDMLLLMMPHILPVLTSIINTSIDTGQFPTIWQHAMVRPLPKNNNPATLNDLRSISVLPCASKILEKVVGDQVRGYLEENDILPVVQSGFRKQPGVPFGSP